MRHEPPKKKKRRSNMHGKNNKNLNDKDKMLQRIVFLVLLDVNKKPIKIYPLYYFFFFGKKIEEVDHLNLLHSL